MLRGSLADLINKEPDLVVCGETDNAREALGLLAGPATAPDIAVVDISLRDSSGLELLKDVKARGLSLPILVLSMHEESLYAERVLRAGARGYITKQEAAREVMNAIRTVLGGEVYLSRKVSSTILRKMSQGNGQASGVAQLTDRELEVFELIGRGRSTREISARINLGSSTVETYRARIKTKLGLSNAAQLTHEAIRWVQAGQPI